MRLTAHARVEVSARSSRLTSERPLLEIAGLCLASTALPGAASAQTIMEHSPAPRHATSVTGVVVTAHKGEKDGDLLKLSDTIQNTPRSIDVITQAAMRQQGATSLQDALKYVPGITLNSGEGGAHGDNVNLRGLRAIDGFFLDGVRDPGSYTRDSFDLQTVQVLQGPAAVLFGNGPAGGVVNQTSKLPSPEAARTVSFETGTNNEFRGTLDINQPLGHDAALRLNLMGEDTKVTDRDFVHLKRWAAAPSLALGLGDHTSLTLSYFHQQEDNTPDYGVPFLFGAPAAVNRSFYYGLKNDDVTQTDADIVTSVLRRDIGDAVSISNTFRYANYWSNYRVSAPIFGNDFVGGPPDPGTPLSDILIYRDRPSSEGTQTYLTDHTDLTANFATGPFTHALITGVEIGRQTTDYVRFDNGEEGVDGVDPTWLLAPNARERAPDQHTIDARPNTTADMIGVYATDQIGLTKVMSLDLGVRFDRYDTHFDDSVSDTRFHRLDQAWSPRVALVLKPLEGQTFYASYATSFDPAASYLTLAPDTNGPPPQTANTYEIGAKSRWLDGRMQSTVALFQIEAANVVVSDPDDPTLQEIPGSHQRVQGVELTAAGHLTRQLEVSANYTYIQPTITASGIPEEVGKQMPGAARNTANLWLVYEPTEDWQIGTGVNYVGQRYADSLNTASVPSYALWNALISYRVTRDVRVQLNVQNMTDERYFTGAYYSDANENHVLPGQGRVVTLNTSLAF